jgi:hypothetical protein
MSGKMTGPTQVQPNTLQGQSIPNTFRSQGSSGAVVGQYLNSGGGSSGLAPRLAVPGLPLRLIVVLVVILVFAALYLLGSTP